MENSYKAKVYCTNCDFRGAIEIPKGQTIVLTKCVNCGTAKLIKDQSVVLRDDTSEDYI